jgi:transposase
MGASGRALARRSHLVYRRRNLIERLFCRLKNGRHLATRYDRLARNYLAALALVAVATEWT